MFGEKVTCGHEHGRWTTGEMWCAAVDGTKRRQGFRLGAASLSLLLVSTKKTPRPSACRGGRLAWLARTGKTAGLD